MGFAGVVACCLLGQVPFALEDSLNQWENRLIESRWMLVDEATKLPQALLVLKCFHPDHRVFELYMFGRGHECEDRLWLRAWTGTYKMERREYASKGIVESLVRLKFEQHWLPVDPYKPDRLRRWMRETGLVEWARERYAVRWLEDVGLLDWIEEVDFKPFMAELKLDNVPSQSAYYCDAIRFLLRSDDVKHVGWWPIGVDQVFTPVPKQSRWRTALP
jgi:hypothetical protein